MRVFSGCVLLFAAVTVGLPVTPAKGLTGVEETHRHHGAISGQGSVPYRALAGGSSWAA